MAAAILCLDPIITTTHGKVRGRQRRTIYDDKYFCFDGIPYAKPPLGELRFRAPQSAEPWVGIRDCTEVAPKCLQYNRFTEKVEGSEDCLYLNIYIKTFQTPKRLPVMVYIHGGMYTTGDASRNSWGPDYFMMKEIVFISIGHRLGPLGFLSLTDPSLKVPGNAGIKDLILALKWIKSNCAFFNGDPDNITVLGHSSGSGSTHLLMLSQHCLGLFHKAILMAGYLLDFVKLPDLAYRLAKNLGFDGENNEKEVLKFLSSQPPEKLVNSDILTPEEKKCGIFIPFGPCVESYENEHSVMLKSPIELLRSTWSNKIPIMMGNTSNEGLLLYKKYVSKEYYELCREKPEKILPTFVQFNCNIELQQKFVAKLKELHYGKREVAIENYNCGIDLKSYKSSYHNCHRIMLARRLKRDNARTYLYRFDFDSPKFNFYRIKHCGPEVRGATHVDELGYLFLMPQSYKLKRDSAEFKTITRMIDIWTRFAATSNPNAGSVAPIIWEPLERNNMERAHTCLNISNELSFIDWPEYAKCKVWDTLYEESGLKLF